MTVLINSLAVTEANKIYYKPEIRNLLESHVQFIIDHPNTQVVTLPMILFINTKVISMDFYIF